MKRALVTVALSVGIPGCARQEPAQTPPSADPAGRHQVLARATSTAWPALTLEVTDLQRPAADVLEVRLAVVNAPTGPAFDAQDAFCAAPAEAGTFSGVFLMDSGGTRKYFVLRDGSGRPQCSTGLARIAPGGRGEGFVRFVSPGSDVVSVTVHVPGFAPAGPLRLAGRGATRLGLRETLGNATGGGHLL